MIAWIRGSSKASKASLSQEPEWISWQVVLLRKQADSKHTNFRSEVVKAFIKEAIWLHKMNMKRITDWGRWGGNVDHVGGGNRRIFSPRAQKDQRPFSILFASAAPLEVASSIINLSMFVSTHHLGLYRLILPLRVFDAACGLL